MTDTPMLTFDMIPLARRIGCEAEVAAYRVRTEPATVTLEMVTYNASTAVFFDNIPPLSDGAWKITFQLDYDGYPNPQTVEMVRPK